MNGIDAVLIATGNDWRAVEAGAHAYAARSGHYRPLSQWSLQGTTLQGQLVLPMALGTVGGMTRLHPFAQVTLKLLRIQHAEELARVVTGVGLLQNLGALRALCSVGIVQGHMALHAANLARTVGASAQEMGEVKKGLRALLHQKKTIGTSDAREVLNQLRAGTLSVPLLK